MVHENSLWNWQILRSLQISTSFVAACVQSKGRGGVIHVLWCMSMILIHVKLLCCQSVTYIQPLKGSPAKASRAGLTSKSCEMAATFSKVHHCNNVHYPNRVIHIFYKGWSQSTFSIRPRILNLL